MKNLKKMWIISVLLGLVFTTVLYLFLNQNHDVTNKDQTMNEAIEQENSSSEVNQEENGDLSVSTNKNEENNDDLNEYDTQSNHFTIEHGKRAISIPVNEIQSVSEFIEPGDFIDVVVIFPSLSGEEESSQILLQKIKVLATGNNLDNQLREANAQEIASETNSEAATNPNNSYKIITLEVLPQEGAALAYAQEKGYYTLMLRDKGDEGISPHVHISVEGLTKGVIPR